MWNQECQTIGSQVFLDISRSPSGQNEEPPSRMTNSDDAVCDCLHFNATRSPVCELLAAAEVTHNSPRSIAFPPFSAEDATEQKAPTMLFYQEEGWLKH